MKQSWKNKKTWKRVVCYLLAVLMMFDSSHVASVTAAQVTDISVAAQGADMPAAQGAVSDDAIQTPDGSGEADTSAALALYAANESDNSEEQDEELYRLYYGSQALDVCMENGTINFERAVSVSYGTSLSFTAKNGAGEVASNLTVYYSTMSDIKYVNNNLKGDIDVDPSKVITDDTILDAGDYCLFFTSDEGAEIGQAPDENTGGSVKFCIRVSAQTLAACSNLRWGTGDEKMCAMWDAPDKDADGNPLVASTQVQYQVSLYYGQEQEAIAVSALQSATSYDFSDEITKAVSEDEMLSGKGYGDYYFKVTASAKAPQDNNYGQSTSGLSEAYHYSDTIAPVITSYQIATDAGGRKLTGSAMDEGTGIAGFVFADQKTAVKDLNWQTPQQGSVQPGESMTAEVSLEEAGIGEIWFYVKDADGNISCQKVELTPEGMSGNAVFISKVTGIDYYDGNTAADYAIFLVNEDSVSLPVVSKTELVRTGYTFGGWYTDAQYTKRADASMTPGTTEGFDQGTEYVVRAKWTEQEISFSEQPQSVSKTYDGENYVLRAALADSVTYDSVSWNWYYKKTEDAQAVLVDASRTVGLTQRSTTCTVTDVAQSGSYYAVAVLTVGTQTRQPAATSTAKCVIEKRPLVVKVADVVITYQDDVPVYTFEAGENGANGGPVGTDTVKSLLGEYESGITCSYQKGDPHGDYTISYTGDADDWSFDNYAVSLSGTGTGTLTVEPLDLTGSSALSATLSQNSYVYDGKEKKPAVESVTLTGRGAEPVTLQAGEDGDYMYTYRNNVRAGQENTAVVISFCGNYKGTFEVPFEIKKGTYAARTSISGWKYGERAQTPSVDTILDGGSPDYYYLPVGTDANGKVLSDSEALAAFERDDFDDSAKTTEQPVHAGKYYVWAEIAQTSNYEQVKAQPAVFTIEKRTIIIEPESLSWEYDGNVHTAGSITPDQIKGDGFVGEDDFLSIAVSGSIKDRGQVDIVVEPKLNKATNPNDYEIEIKHATLTITAAKLVAPSTFKWSATPGTLSWIAISKDGLQVKYKLSLYRAQKNENGTIKRDSYGEIVYDAQPVATAVTGDTSYSFLQAMLDDTEQKKQQYAYAATIQVVPVYGENEVQNYVESDASSKTALKYTAKVTLQPAAPSVKTAYIGQKPASEEETAVTSAVLLQGQSIDLHMEPAPGYRRHSATWTVGEAQKDYVSFDTTDSNDVTLTLEDQSSMNQVQEIFVGVSATDDYPAIQSADASMALDATYVKLDLAFSDVLGLDAYALVKADAETDTPDVSGADWKTIPEDENGSSVCQYETTEYIYGEGIYFVCVRDTSNNIVYLTTPVVVYQISFAKGAEEEQVTGEMPLLVKLKDQAVTLPQNRFKRAGYGMTNWTGTTGIYANGGNYIANESDVLTAGWTDEKVNYTVQYFYQKLTETTNEEGGVTTVLSYESAQPVSFSCQYGETISCQKPEIQAAKAGYQLTTTPAGVTDYASSIIATENGQILQLYYNLEQYRITYRYTDTDGQEKAENVPYYYGQSVKEKEKPSAIGYTFIGWDWGEAGQAPEVMPGKNLAVTGYFQADQTKYYIVYYTQNLDQDISNSQNGYVAKAFQKEDALTEEMTAEYGDKLLAALSEESTADDVQMITARQMTGFTPAAVQISYGSPVTIDEGNYDTWMDGTHTRQMGTVQKELTAEEREQSPDTVSGPTYICFYYKRNQYQITMDVYKDARENNIHLFGSYYDGTQKTNPDGVTVTENDQAKWTLPYGYLFADESASVAGDGMDGDYKASYFETFGYKPLLSEESGAHSRDWTARWPQESVSKDKYYLATFVDWSTGERPASMPAGHVSVTREYASKELSKYVIEVYTEKLTGVTQSVTLDDGSEQNVTLQKAMGDYAFATSYERYGNAGDQVVIVDDDDMPAEVPDGYVYLKVSDIVKGVPDYKLYEHNPESESNAGESAQKEVLTGIITENTVEEDGKIGSIVTLRLNLDRKKFTTVVRYHKMSSGIDENGNSVPQNEIFATKQITEKWGTEFLADPLYFFDGNADDEAVVNTETARQIAGTDFRNGNYLASYSGYYWLPQGGNWPSKQYTTPSEFNAAPALKMTVGGSSDGTDYVSGNYQTSNTTPARSYMEVYYAEQEITKHYYLKQTYEKCQADSNDPTVIRETNQSTNMILTADESTYPELSAYGTKFQVCVANKCDVFEAKSVSSNSGAAGDDAYARYPGAYYLNGFAYEYEQEDGKDKLRDGFAEVTLTYHATENRDMDGTGGTEKEETGVFYIPLQPDGNGSYTNEAYTDQNGNCLLFAVDEKNQFYNGHRISYRYDTAVAAHVGRELFMADSNRPTTGRVVEVANTTGALQTNGKDFTSTRLTDMKAVDYQAYYYNVYNDYYLTFWYDGSSCSSCDNHDNYAYNALVDDFTCNHFSVGEGYYIAWYMDSAYETPAAPFRITKHTDIYGRKEKKPVENWDYAFYKLPEKKTIQGSSYDWITNENVGDITWTDRSQTKDNSETITADNVDNTANITGVGQEMLTKSVSVPYRNEHGGTTNYMGLRTEWYVDGQLVMVKQPNYSMTYIEFYMDYTQYEVPGCRYDETNTKNKSKAFCSVKPVNMYAYFTRDSYTLTVTRNRNKNDNDEVTTRTCGAWISLEDPVKDGYVFREWKLQKVTTGENGEAVYTDLVADDYGYTHKDAQGEQAGQTVFRMPIGNTRALAVWAPATLQNFKITHYLQDENKAYQPELLKQVQTISENAVPGTVRTITISRNDETADATAYYDGENLLAVSCRQGDYTYYYTDLETGAGGMLEAETADAFAVVQDISGVKSEDMLLVKAYKLTGLGDIFAYAFTKYQQDTTQLTLTEQTTDEAGVQSDSVFAVYPDAVAEYYYTRSSSIRIRTLGLSADAQESGLTLSGGGDHYYGETVTLYATMQPNGYTFQGWFRAEDVLQGYPQDGTIPDSLDTFALKEGILDAIAAGEIQPVTDQKSYGMMVKKSMDFVALTDAGTVGNPTLTVTSKRSDYLYQYKNDTNNVITATVNWGEAGAGANTIKKYTWYVKYYDISGMSEEQITELRNSYETTRLSEMDEIPNSDSGMYLFPTGKDAGYYVYRCVAEIERKDNGRTGTAEGSCLLVVGQNRDYYETAPVSVDYDGNLHTYTESFAYGTKANGNIKRYYSKTEIRADISDDELQRRLALGEEDDDRITESIISFRDVVVDTAQKEKPVIAHQVYYCIRSTDPNYATLAGQQEVRINPVWLTIESVRPFVKIYDASEKVNGAYGVKKADGTDSDFHRLQTGSDCADGKGYYVLHGVLPCDRDKTLYLNFEASFDSAHVSKATVVTLSDMRIVQEDVNRVFDNYNYRFRNGSTLQMPGQIKPYPLEIKWIPHEDSDTDKDYAESEFVYNYDGTEKHPFVVITDTHTPDQIGDFKIQINNGQKSVSSDPYEASAEVVASESASYEPSDYTFTLETCPYRILPRYIKVEPKTMKKVYNGANQTMVKTDTVNEFIFYTKESAQDTWREYAHLPAGERFSVSATASGKETGEYVIGAQNLKILNENDKNISDNYEISYGTGKLTIVPCPVAVVEGIKADDKPYDGTEEANVNVEQAVLCPLQTNADGTVKTDAHGKAMTESGLFAGDALAIDGSKVTGTFENANAGTDKTVYLQYDNSSAAENGSGGALIGISKNNYTLATAYCQKTATASILSTTQLTVSVNDMSYVYGEKPAYEAYRLSYTGFRPNDNADNAVSTSDSDRAVFEIKTKEEDGSYKTVVSDGTSDAMKTLDAGTYYIFIRTKDGAVSGEAAGLKSDNYTIVTGTSPATLQVLPRPIAIAAKAEAGTIKKTYDGTTDVTQDLAKTDAGVPVYYTFTKTQTEGIPAVENEASGVVNGDDITVSSYQAAYNSKNVADAESVIVTNISLTGEQAGNYILQNTIFALQGEIEKKEMTVKIEDKTTVYGEDKPAFTYKVTGAVAKELQQIKKDVAEQMRVSCAYSTSDAQSANRNAGTYAIEADSSNQYANENCYSNPNYKLTFENGVLTVNKRVVYYRAADKYISYGKENPPEVYEGAFVADDTENLYDGWCYQEGISAGEGITQITLYTDEACQNELASGFGGYTVTFSCKESQEEGAADVSKDTPYGEYVIKPDNVEDCLFAENYVFINQTGTLHIAKYYLTVENVEVLGKIYDGTKNVAASHLLTEPNDTIYTGGYPGLKFTYYEGAVKVEGTAKELAQREGFGEAYVRKLMESLDISAAYRSADVCDESIVDIKIRLKSGTYLDDRYVLLTADNLQEAIAEDSEKYQETSPVTQTEATAFIIGADGSRKKGGIQKRPLTLYPEDTKILYGQDVAVVTHADAAAGVPYSRVRDRRPGADAENKEIGFAAREDFSTIGFMLQSSIKKGSTAYSAGSDVGTYTIDISASCCSSAGNYDVSYEQGTLTVSQNTFPAPEKVQWDETDPGKVTWTKVDPIGEVTVSNYRVDLYRNNVQVGSSRYTENGESCSMDLLDMMRENGAGAYTVSVCAQASETNNVVGGQPYANVAQFGAEQKSAVKYAAQVTVQFSTDTVTQEAGSHASRAVIYPVSGSSESASDHYVMIAGESGVNLSYSWSRMGIGSGSSTIYKSGYQVDSVTVDNGNADFGAYEFGSEAGYGNAAEGTYQNTFALSNALNSASPVSVTLKLKEKEADLTLSVTEQHNPQMTEIMYGYTSDARPVYQAQATSTDDVYDYAYEWSFTKGMNQFNAQNLQQETQGEVTIPIIWDQATFYFPLGQSYFSSNYRITCKVTAKRKDNGKTTSANVTKNLRIKKAKGDKNFVSVNVLGGGWTYGQSRYQDNGTGKISATKRIEGLGPVTLEYRTQEKAAEGEEAGWDCKEPTDAGSYQVRANVAASDNYEEFVTDPVSYEIWQATLDAPQNIQMTKSDTAPYGLVTWDSVTGPKENAGEGAYASYIDLQYEVTLSRQDIDAGGNGIGEKQDITTVTTSECQWDFSALITEAGKYFVTVQSVVKPRPVKQPQEDDSREKQSYDGQDVHNCKDSACSTFTALITIGATITCDCDVTADGYAKVYDGTALTLTAVYGSGSDATRYQWMKDGQKIGEPTADNTLSITYVKENALYACEIYPDGDVNAVGDYVYTRNVKAEIIPRKITITADTLEKEYDGTPLQTTDTDNWQISESGLAQGDSILYGNAYSALTNVTTKSNKVTSVTICRGSGEDVRTVYTYDTTDPDYPYNNYRVNTVDGTLKVTARSLGTGMQYTNGISVADIPDTIYDGTAKKPDESTTDQVVVKDLITDENGTKLLDATLTKNTDYTVSYENNKKAGTATVKIEGKGNYTGTITQTFFIGQRTVQPVWGQDSFVYTNEQKTVSANDAAKISGDKVSFVYSGNQAVEAGNYRAEITGLSGTDAGNYTIRQAEGLEHDWSIGKADGSITISGNSSKIYDGTPVQDPAYEKAGTGTVTFVYYTQNEEGSYVPLPDAAKPTNAGTYYVKAFVGTDNNYNSAQSDYKEIIIEKRSVTIAAQKAESVYGETPAAMTYQITAGEGVATETAPNALVSGNDLGTISAYAKEAETESAPQISRTTPAGNYIIHIAYTTNANYAVTTTDETYTVKQAQQQLTVADVTTVYDGNTHEVEVEEANHPVGDGNISVTYRMIQDADQNPVTGDAQTNRLLSGKPVHAGVYQAKITAGATRNYKEKTVTATVTIGRRALKLQTDSDSRPYDTTALTKHAYTLLGGTTLAQYDQLILDYAGSLKDVKYDEENSVVSVPNSATVVKIENENSLIGDVTGDYTIQVSSGSLKVVPRTTENGADFHATFDAPDGVVKVGDDTFEWTGEEIEPVLVITDETLPGTSASGTLVLEQGKDYSITGEQKESAVGTYTMTVTLQGNFEGSMTVIWKIKDVKKPAGTVKVAEYVFEKLFETITFGLFFKAEQTVEITGEEEKGGSGIQSLSYYCLEQQPGETTVLTQQQLAALGNVWTDVTGNDATEKQTTDGREKWKFRFKLSPDWKGVVYTRITDKAGHVTYLSSDGIVIEDDKPQIQNVSADTTYCISRSVTVQDTYLDSVTVSKIKDRQCVSQESLAVQADGTCTFTLNGYEEGTYTITARDRAGNETVVSGICIRTHHTWTYQGSGTDTVTATCMQETCDTYHETEDLTVTISANNCDYTGQPKVATVTKSSAFSLADAGSVGEIRYYRTAEKGQLTGGEEVSAAVNAGYYYAKAAATDDVQTEAGESAYVVCAFEIRKVQLTEVSLAPDRIDYTGQKTGPDEIRVYADIEGVKTLLDQNTDYQLTENESARKVTKAVRAGSYTVEASGTGNFTGTVSAVYIITESEQPVISGVADNGYYCRQVQISVSDNNLDSFKVIKENPGAESETVFEKNNITGTQCDYTLIGEEENGARYTVIATDSAGNTSRITGFTVYKDHSFPVADYTEAADGNSQSAPCAHACGETDTKVVVQGSVHWDYSYENVLPDGTVQDGLQEAQARATYAKITLYRNGTSIAQKTVNCDESCGTGAQTPADTFEMTYRFTSYDPAAPGSDSGDVLLPVEQDGAVCSYVVTVEPVRMQGTEEISVTDYVVNYVENGHIGKQAMISYMPGAFEVPWKVTLFDLPVAGDAVQAPEAIYVKVLYASSDTADDSQTDAGYQIISQQAAGLGTLCRRADQSGTDVCYEGKYPVWKYQGGTENCYYYRIQITGYLYQGTYYDVSDKMYRSPNGQDHETQTIYYAGETEQNPGGASGTILYHLEGLRMPVVVFDYNEGEDETNRVTGNKHSIVKTQFGEPVTEQEIREVSVQRQHYAFEGWYDAEEGGNRVTKIDALQGSVTLYAHWRELVAPNGSITIQEHTFTKFLQSITFGLFFKETQRVKIEAWDDGIADNVATGVTNSGIQEIAYYILTSSLEEELTPLTGTQVAALPASAWVSYTEPFSISPQEKDIIYARIKDNAGNITYLSSDGLLLENTPPVMTGAQSDTTYCLSRTIDITDDRLDSLKVTLSDGTVYAQETGITQTEKQIILPGRNDAKTYTVTACDKAGNIATLSGVSVRADHTWQYTLTADNKLRAFCGVETCDTYHEAENLTVTLEAATAEYDGKAHTASVIASEAFETAQAGQIGTIQYFRVDEHGTVTGGEQLLQPPVHAGFYYAQVQVSADEGQSKTLRKSFEITPVQLHHLELEKSSVTYHGRKQENPETITAIVDGREILLQKDIDYILTTGNDTDAGWASVSANGIGDYAGQLAQQYEILPAKITVSANDAESGYGNEMAPLTSYVAEGEIFEGDDLHLGAVTDATAKSPFGTYEIRPVYDENPNYEVTSVNGVYTIRRGILSVDTDGYEGVYDSLAHGISMHSYDNSEKMTIYYATVPLDENNYRQSGSTDMPTFTDIGTYTVYYYIVSEHYAPVSGSEEVVITERSVAKEEQTSSFTLSVADIADMTYDGTDKKPTPQIVAHYTVTENGKTVKKDMTLKKDVDYVLFYTNNKNAGTATVTVNGIGNYSNVLTKTFRILPKEVVLQWSQNKFTYNGKEKTVTAKVINAATASDDVTVNVYKNNKKTKTGTYTAEALSLKGKDAANYRIGSNSRAKWEWSIVQAQDGNTENDPEDKTATFGALKAKSVKQTKTSVTVTWTKMSGADGYLVYGGLCNKGNKVHKKKLLKMVTDPNVRTYTHKKLKPGTYYKYTVKAYKIVNGKKVIIASSVSVHAVTAGGKYGVAKSVKIQSVGGKKTTKITLKKGKTAKIKATEVKKKLRIQHHRGIAYESSNKKIATVSADGKITAKKKGTCKIWVYAQNGVYKTITVTVK